MGPRATARSRPRRPALAFAAEAECAARAEVSRTFKAMRDRTSTTDPATKAWHDAIARWHRMLERVYPAAFRTAFADLKQTRIRDPAMGVRWTRPPDASIETAIAFLEADPMCFRSGYVKEKLARRLRRQTLKEDEKVRLRTVVLAVLDRGNSREFRDFCGLAARIADEGLIAAIEARGGSEDEALRRRAGWMRAAISKLRADGRGGEARGERCRAT